MHTYTCVAEIDFAVNGNQILSNLLARLQCMFLRCVMCVSVENGLYSKLKLKMVCMRVSVHSEIEPYTNDFAV